MIVSHYVPNAWTQEEMAYLREHYDTDTEEAIAEHLKRTVNAIRVKACDMRLRKKTKRVYITAAMDVLIYRCRQDGLTMKQTAEELGVKYESLYRHCQAKKIKFKKERRNNG